MSDPSSTAIERYQAPPALPAAPAGVLSNDEIDRMQRIAKALAESRQFKDVNSVYVAFARMMLGRDIGLTPVQSLMSLDVVEGNLQMRGVLLLSFVRRHPRYDYEVMHSDREYATLRFHGYSDRTGQWEILGDETYTIEDAKRAGLVKDHAKAAWNAHRKNMLMWRAASNGVKFYCPDLLGGIPVYTEADDVVQVPNLAEGVGDGSEPGWQGVSLTHAATVEALVERAARLGLEKHADIAMWQMKLNSRDAEYVERYIADRAAEIDKFEQDMAAQDAENDEVPIGTLGEIDG